ncbi:beta-N-acetylhexosaminidase [Kordiimonas sp. SCSIO 12603]|uniref:beta-N-acetylhexosaminidase n=1 Tax=Kordiimonas sp. SCSIO 12603 TaxID=2829596 RepID=UPI0021039752|nr:beta-N-acetylhexosaminidase [Kordiimonas sp. SCSIO 12603]UTW57689.1 beta-N-acetylhexosaminidase [Kordiimonas sp. SCSIO 12603]
MKPIIFGCSGPELTEAEFAFFQKNKPAGFILFARNVEDKAQLSRLTSDLKRSVGRHKVPVLIDQEGGRVQRMTEPHWRKYPPMGVFGEMALKDPTLAASALRLNCRLMADDLRKVGVNVNCLPLLDVRQKEADAIIGDRAFSGDPNLVAALGRITVDALQEGGVLPVVKHIPGHGRAMVDSHLKLPVVDASVEELEETDFAPFKALKDAPFAMTAHIVYSALDSEKPATLSRQVIARTIRMKMGFSGLLMTDDLSMKALSGSFAERSKEALDAGCDLLLHCNGDMAEMEEVASVCHGIDAGLEKRIANLVRDVEQAPMIDRGDVKRRLEELMSKF